MADGWQGFKVIGNFCSFFLFFPLFLYTRPQNIPMMMEKKFLTLREASELLSMSVKALRMHILRGHLPAYKLGGKIYLKLEEIEKALKPIGARAGKGASQNNKGGTK